MLCISYLGLVQTGFRTHLDGYSHILTEFTIVIQFRILLMRVHFIALIFISIVARRAFKRNMKNGCMDGQ